MAYLLSNCCNKWVRWDERHLKEFFAVTTTAETITQTRYLGRGRPTAKSVQEQVTRINLQLQFQQQSAAIEHPQLSSPYHKP